MHLIDAPTEVLTQAVLRYAVNRIRLDPPPLDAPRPEAELRAMAGRTITPRGIGGLEALRVWDDVLAPSCLSSDHPRYLSFVPTAPTEAAILFDLVVGASCIYGGSWLEGAGAVFAENEALRWLADLAGFPADAGGVFVTGGTAGNLSALVAARHKWRLANETQANTRGLIVAGAGAHSSVAAAARTMDCDVLRVPPGERGRLVGPILRRTLDELSVHDQSRLFAVVATGGTTNLGIVDDLAGVAEVAADHDLWFHVDCAYGGAALAAPSVRRLFAGIEVADSFVIDPHKWLFAPYDCAALLYRDPSEGRRAHTQHAEYLDVLTESEEWNPSDYAHHLTRRARGLPFWFSLATYGTDAYTAAVELGLALARTAETLLDAAPHTEVVVGAELSIVVFRRLGWGPAEYKAWSDGFLHRGLGLVVPTSHEGETVLRFCFVNPRTTVADIEMIIADLADPAVVSESA